MTKEEKKQLEDAATAARQKADEAHQAAADADGADDTLNTAADQAEDEALKAEQEANAAVIDGEKDPSENPEETPDEGAGIDFEKELQNLETPDSGKPPAKRPARTEKEKAAFALKQTARRLKALGEDPMKILGERQEPQAPPDEPEDESESRFVTKDYIAEVEAGKLSRSEAEQKVLMHHYRNSIQRTGNVVQDIERAYLIAHQGKITRSFDEIRRGQQNRPPVGGPGVGRKPPAKPQVPTLSGEDQNTLRRRGYAPQADGSWTSRRYRVRFDSKKREWVTEPKT